jgi:peroxiredoxin Q/BCP
MLKVGDKIPNISLHYQNDCLVNLAEITKNKPSVIYFYPKDETPGCTAEACGFRDHYEDFSELGAEIYGISADSPASHRKFKERHRLNFTLLSDEKKVAEKAFGVPRILFGLLPGRVTFIFDKNGVVQHTFNSALNPTKHISEALKKLKELI